MGGTVVVAAIHDVREPVAIVLDQRVVAIGKRTFRGEQPTAIAICIKVTSKAASNGLNADDERIMTARVGSAEEIGKLRRLQELVEVFRQGQAQIAFLPGGARWFRWQGLTIPRSVYSRNL